MEWQEILDLYKSLRNDKPFDALQKLEIDRIALIQILEKLAKDETEKKEKIQANCCHGMLSKKSDSEEWKCDHCDAVIRRI